ncbi:MAG: hypothetical protein LUP99_01475 [Methanomicrobiales archaeon]|nr:hypothetical protein [Methanomicrobiales archaeon]
MNWRVITGILCAGIIPEYVFLSCGAAFRDLFTAYVFTPSIISNGVLVLNFVLAVAIWDSGTNIITRENQSSLSRSSLAKGGHNIIQYTREFFTCGNL